MPRRARIAPGEIVYHVLNRANGRNELFHKPEDYFLAQTIDLRQTGGVFDAVALCCLQIEEDFPAGITSSDLKILSPLDPL